MTDETTLPVHTPALSGWPAGTPYPGAFPDEAAFLRSSSQSMNAHARAGESFSVKRVRELGYLVTLCSGDDAVDALVADASVGGWTNGLMLSVVGHLRSLMEHMRVTSKASELLRAAAFYLAQVNEDADYPDATAGIVTRDEARALQDDDQRRDTVDAILDALKTL